MAQGRDPEAGPLAAVARALGRFARLETRHDRRIFVTLLACLAWLAAWAVLKVM